MRLSALLLFILCSLACTAQLSISVNKRFLQTPDGKPFFWLGDTAWELFHRLNREDAIRYLQDRKEKGFTVIQAVVLAELDGLHDPNPYGAIPLHGDNPSTPNEKYFTHVDFIIERAADLGMFIALLPTWGDKVFKDRWGVGPEIFTPDNAYRYGQWLGTRYKNARNVVWVLGGDRNPQTELHLEIWRKMASGIEEGTGNSEKALITFHPQPTSLQDGGSSKYFHDEKWLDFNMFQTGHCREINVGERIQVAYNKLPAKPVLDGEPIYEDHPVCFNATDLGTSSAYDVRKAAYLDVFAGAFGHTYGCHDIWQMYAPGRKAVNGPHFAWYDALDLPGAQQMKYLRILVESRPFFERIPDQSIIDNPRNANDRVQASRGNDYAVIYSAQGLAFKLDTRKISGEGLIATWYNPRNGETKDGGIISEKNWVNFEPPASGYGMDWVLILDDASKNYPKPDRNTKY